jgi:large subunit ribosomal protein L21
VLNLGEIMKKAVISTGGRQYIVSEGDEITVNLLATDKKALSFDALMLVDGKDSVVGTPNVAKVTVSAEVVEADMQADKVMAIRYKSKKRVHKVRGHRQRQTVLKITSIK